MESTHQAQPIARLRIYAGADGDITLYQDDATTYAYEGGECRLTRLHWNDVAGLLSQEGFPLWVGSGAELIEVVGR